MNEKELTPQLDPLYSILLGGYDYCSSQPRLGWMVNPVKVVIRDQVCRKQYSYRCTQYQQRARERMADETNKKRERQIVGKKQIDINGRTTEIHVLLLLRTTTAMYGWNQSTKMKNSFLSRLQIQTNITEQTKNVANSHQNMDRKFVQ